MRNDFASLHTKKMAEAELKTHLKTKLRSGGTASNYIDACRAKRVKSFLASFAVV